MAAVAARDELADQQADLALFSGATGPVDAAQSRPSCLQPSAAAFQDAVMGIGDNNKGDKKAAAAARGIGALAGRAAREAGEPKAAREPAARREPAAKQPRRT